MLRTDIINKFIKKRKYTSYLEIGTRQRADNFDKIVCKRKMCIDPDPESNAYLKMTSDQFFECNRMSFDCIFIDGLHEGHQVYKDIINSLKVLNPNGLIVCHDCNPQSVMANIDPNYYKGIEVWIGDSWKGFVKYRFNTDYLCYVIDEDEGCGIIDTTKQSEVKEKTNVFINELYYGMLNTNRNFFLDLRPYNKKLL